MRVKELRPCPTSQTQFAWSHHVTVPTVPGCYALTTYAGVVLYVGLASSAIADRMSVHLETTEKRKGAVDGVPFWFYYLECTADEVDAIERGWMNQSILEDGEMPPLNKIYGRI